MEGEGNQSFAASQIAVFQTSNVPEFNPSVEAWNVWKERLDIHFCEISCTDDNVKKSILLKSIGAVAYKMLHSLCSPVSPVSKKYEELCEILDTQYTPPTIVFSERKKFHVSTKSDSETVAEWYARVKTLALNCKFGANLDAFVLNQFVMGLPHFIFERLCEEDESLTVQVALKKAMIMETKSIAKEAEREQSSVNLVQKQRLSNKYNGSGGGGRGYGSSGNRGSNSNRGSGNSSNRGNGYNNNRGNGYENNRSGGRDNRMEVEKKAACSHCGWRNHSSQACKYKESKCHSCGRNGHLASVCHNKKRSVNYVSNDIDNNDDDYDNDDLFNYSIFSVAERKSSDVYSLQVVIDGVELNAVCDTGAPCTLMPACFYKENNIKKTLRPCNIPYVDYNGDKLKLVGEYDASVTFQGKSKSVVVVVVNSSNPPLLGRSFLRSFNFELLQVNNIGSMDSNATIIEQIKNEFSEVFQDKLGEYNVSKISLKIAEDAAPVFCKPRPLPLAWKGKIEKKLRDLISSGVLEPVDNSDWGTPLVPILKPNGDLRICGDYKVTLNKFLLDFKYPLPRIDEIFASLEGGEVFTKLDLSNAYNQLVLDEESQFLCAWSTHIGTLKVKRLPFGVKTAAAIFQKTMENLLRDIPYVVVYQDDITITGKNMQEHIRTLKRVLQKLQSSGLKLNLNKSVFFQSEISYLGFNIDKHGLRKNNDRISSIISCPIPKNISELRAFVGMANYYSKFINDFAKIMSPLYNLLSKDVAFDWSDKCHKSFEDIKKSVTSDQILVHFNPDLPIILTTDASNNAVAGILSHRFSETTKPIAFVSRALTKSEKNYSTLEKEALAIVFSVTKLRQYLLGNKLILRTDHRPLLAIFGSDKGLPVMASARMQRWALILSGFNYTIEYVKGIKNEADSISRMPQKEFQSDNVENSYINFIEANEAGFKIDFKDISRETRRDPILSRVVDCISNGTLNNIAGANFTPFREKYTQLTVEYGCILWGYRTIIPDKLKEKVLNELHRSHLGIVKTKALARSYIWWPGLDKDIENLIKNCLPCQKLQSSPEKSSLIPWVPNDSVWSRIHIDFAGPIRNFYFLIVIDSFSKFVEVFKTKDMTTAFTVSRLRELFSRYGIVDTLVSDNGTQFTSHDFETFLSLNGIKHILTAPGHPSTNGQAENFVKTFKKSIYANLEQNKDANLDQILYRFLMDYRNMTHCSTGECPAKIFFGRKLKTRFSLLKPPTTTEKIINAQENNVRNHKGNRNIQFTEGQKVMVRDYRNPNKSSWAQAKIKQQLGPQSYSCILSHNNYIIKRHLDQIRGQQQKQQQIVDLQAPTTNTLSSDGPQQMQTTEDISHTRRELRPREGGRVVRKPDSGTNSNLDTN